MQSFEQTDLRVSCLCLGTMTFSKPVDQQEATRMVDVCLDVEKLSALAKKAGRRRIIMSFGWLLHHKVIDVVMLGASHLEQLKQNLAACNDGLLESDVVRECDDVWRVLRGPAPIYSR
jgi:aryl-alcohol dehydrogenase-like predicted oxidoreductase